jgi:hypothetical protein
MSAEFQNYQPCPPPEGPGLHSYSAALEPPEAPSHELWVTRPEPEPEAEL